MITATSAPVWAPDISKDDPGQTDGWVRPRILPPEVWDARPVLRHIRQAAHARARSADLVLGGTLARLAAMIPHQLKADTGVGSPAPLNLFVAGIGPSGAGKSSAAWIPRDLLPPPPNLDFLDDLPLGTGEGIAEAFMGEVEVELEDAYRSGPKKGQPRRERVRAQVRHNALFHADEGEALIKHLLRTGATIGETLRRAWIGATIGQFNGQRVNTRVIPAGTYSLGIVIGFQPEIVLPLLDDAPAGTPQRFLWVSATDPTIPEHSIDYPGPLNVPLIKHGFGPNTQLTFAEGIRREIRQEDRARATGAIRLPLLDSHRPLMMVKVASLLAILDGRLQVNVEDWQLARIIWDTSCAVRDALLEYGERKQKEEAERQLAAHVERQVRAHAAITMADRRIERVARRVALRVHKAGAAGMSWGQLRKAIAHRERDVFQPALDEAEARGWVVVEGTRITPGDSAPVVQK